MKAAVFHRYGPADVVTIKDVEKPSPKAHQVLVRVVATAVNASDSRVRGAKFPKGFAPFARLAFGITKPRKTILGGCFSGVVESVGASVTDFAPGDEVCGMAGFAMGAHAEFVVADSRKAVANKPQGVSHEDAVGVLFGGTTALYFLRDKAHLERGQKLLINGASGAIGTSAVQLARHFGANVTAVTSAKNSELVRSLGADEVIEYDTQDLFEVASTYDVVLDAVGNISIAAAKKLLTDNGKLLMAVATLGQMLSPKKYAVGGTATEKKESIEYLLGLVDKGELKVVRDQTFALDEIAKAYELVDSGHKVGNVVIRVSES